MNITKIKKIEGRVRAFLNIPGSKALQDNTIEAIYDATMGTTIKNPSSIGMRKIEVLNELWDDIIDVRRFREQYAKKKN